MPVRKVTAAVACYREKRDKELGIMPLATPPAFAGTPELYRMAVKSYLTSVLFRYLRTEPGKPLWRLVADDMEELEVMEKML